MGDSIIILDQKREDKKRWAFLSAGIVTWVIVVLLAIQEVYAVKSLIFYQVLKENDESFA